ncbi:hypothetical protein SRHO_G00014350 [Serrasalmus rhombeus]
MQKPRRAARNHAVTRITEERQQLRCARASSVRLRAPLARRLECAHWMRNCSARCVRHRQDVTESEAFAARPRVASSEEEGTTLVTVSV